MSPGNEMAPCLLFHRSHEFVARSAGLPELHQRAIFLKSVPQRQPEDTFQVPGQQGQDRVQRLVVETFFQGSFLCNRTYALTN